MTTTIATDTIAPEQLAQLCREGRVIDLIDVRTPIEFREVHVDFARNVPLDRLSLPAVNELRSSPPDEPVYVICRSGARGRQARDQLAAAGLTVINVEGGTLACEKAGLPVVRGKKAVALDRQVRIIAGSLVVLGSALGFFVHPAWIALAAFVGAGVAYAGITDSCPMAIMLSRMPWNQVRDEPGKSSQTSSKSCCAG
jgi:rhodanese-related sulfurtransferase